jgi:hypothetical protein
MIGSSDINRVKQAQTIREYNHKCFLSVGDKIDISTDLEVVATHEVTEKFKPKYKYITLWGSITMKVTYDEYEKHCNGF